jgi:hypothetical protein
MKLNFMVYKMAFDTIYFQNPQTNQLREAPVGYSWTCLFFGCFVPLFRGDWKWTLIMFLCSLATYGFSQLVFTFIYNKLYIKDLISEGYRVKSVENGTIAELEKELGIVFDVHI